MIAPAHAHVFPRALFALVEMTICHFRMRVELGQRLHLTAFEAPFLGHQNGTSSS
jgi:hypothetical protein